MKDNLEQNSSDLLLNESYLEQSQQNAAATVHDDDVNVVDSIDNAPINYDKEFVIPPGQILGLDQAVLQSIDRCRK